MIRTTIDETTRRTTWTAFADTPLAHLVDALPPAGPDGPWLAGGALRRTFSGQPLDADLDFFFRDPEQLAAFTASLEALGLVKVNETEHHVHHAGSIGGTGPHVEVQSIRFKYYAGMEELVDSFDLTMCMFAYDGVELVMGDDTLHDLASRSLEIHRLTYASSTVVRLRKYVRQGFRVPHRTQAAVELAAAGSPVLMYV